MNPFSDFWMVWGKGKGEPRVMHMRPELAVNEAKRLANKEPGTQFFVIHVLGYAKRVDPVEYIDLENDRRPF